MDLTFFLGERKDVNHNKAMYEQVINAFKKESILKTENVDGGKIITVGYPGDDPVYNINNKGKVICTTQRVAAAFAVVGDTVVLKNCSNEGEIKCGATTLALGKAWSPLVAGLCAISGDGATVTIENCKNTGAVTGMGQAEQLVQSLYASEGVAHKLADPSWEGSDQTICDQASKDASAGASVTFIPKEQWSDALILSWLQ